MCFSAPASFVTSGGLAAIGVATAHSASQKQKLIAAIPFLFAIQQATEGYQWLCATSSGASYAAAYAFLFFAFILWPIYMPAAVYSVDKSQRRVLKWLIGLGVLLAAYNFLLLALEPLQVLIVHQSIDYHIEFPFMYATVTVYLIVTCGAFLVSRKPGLQWFGAAAFVSAVLSAFFFFKTFTSVWCFFAAALSSMIYLYVKHNR